MHVDVQIFLDVPAVQKVEEAQNQKRSILVVLVG